MKKDISNEEFSAQDSSEEIDYEFFETEELNKFAKEYNLFRLEGFCFDFVRREKQITPDNFSIKIKTNKHEHTIHYRIEYSQQFGKPGSQAYNIYQTIIRKILEHPQPYPRGVSFTARELGRKIGLKKFGGRDSRRIFENLKSLRKTNITGKFYIKTDSKNGKWVERDFNLLDELLTAGDVIDGKEIPTHFYMFLPQSIINNISRNYALLLNYSRLSRLSDPSAHIFFCRIYSVFAYIFSKSKTAHRNKTKEQVVFTKDYKEICKIWFGGLSTYKYKSRIERQFKKQFEELIEVELLAKKPELRKNKRGDSYNIIFVAGCGFFEDYFKFNKTTNNTQKSLPVHQDNEDRNYRQPMEIARYFQQKTTGVENIEERILSQTNINLARHFLEENSFEDILEWIDFALEEAKKTNFKMASLGGIKQYRIAFFDGRKKKLEAEKKRRQQQQIKEEEERQTREYELLLEQKLEKQKQDMTDFEMNELENIAKKNVSQMAQKPMDKIDFTSVAFKACLRQEVNDLIWKKRGGKISFEEWKSTPS